MQKLKELIDAGELGEVLCVYGNRQNLGIIRTDENALWSLGVHDLSVILYLLDEEPEEVWAHGNALPHAGRRGRRLLLPALPVGTDRAHAPVVARPAQDAQDDRRRASDKMVVFDDMELERKVTVYEKGPWQPADNYGEWQTRTGDIFSPRIPNDEPLRLECTHFLELVAGGPGDHREARDGLAVVRALEALQATLAGARV